MFCTRHPGFGGYLVHFPMVFAPGLLMWWRSSTLSWSSHGRFILQFSKFPIPLHSLNRRSILHVPVFGQSTPARMAESVDALVSNTSGAIRAGSIPAPGTQQNASAWKSNTCIFLFPICTTLAPPNRLFRGKIDIFLKIFCLGQFLSAILRRN